METLKDVLNNNQNIRKCEHCGKPYELKEYVLGVGTPKEKRLSIQVPTCDCIDLKEQAEKELVEKTYKKNKLKSLFENSLMTPYLRKKTFENLQQKAYEYGNEKELNQLKQYAYSFTNKSPGIFLTGKPGTGKTSMIAAVCNELITREFNCLFVTFSALIEMFAKYSAENNGDISSLLQWLVKFDFIVIDDIGRENYTDRRKEIAYRIIDAILNYEVSVAFTANPEMIAKLKNIEDWGAMLDRLKDICATQIHFKGESLRGLKWA